MIKHFGYARGPLGMRRLHLSLIVFLLFAYTLIDTTQHIIASLKKASINSEITIIGFCNRKYIVIEV